MNLDDRVEFFDYGIYKPTVPAYGNWVTEFDVNLTNARAALDWYRQRGATVRYFPPGFHLEDAFKTPPEKAAYDYSFSFVGSAKTNRKVIVEELFRAGVSIALFGNGWQNSQWVDCAPSIFRRTQINLGIGFALPNARIITTKGRDFECPGVGACYLTTYNCELPALYDIGTEILCYRDFDELLEMHAYYVKRPAECLRIAQAAHRRCTAEHTWEKRFRALFCELGFKTLSGNNE
jgi:spore maturation protein CgeB